MWFRCGLFANPHRNRLKTDASVTVTMWNNKWSDLDVYRVTSFEVCCNLLRYQTVDISALVVAKTYYSITSGFEWICKLQMYGYLGFVTEPPNPEITALVVAKTYRNIKSGFEWISKIHSKPDLMLQYVFATTSAVFVPQSYLRTP